MGLTIFSPEKPQQIVQLFLRQRRCRGGVALHLACVCKSHRGISASFCLCWGKKAKKHRKRYCTSCFCCKYSKEKSLATGSQGCHVISLTQGQSWGEAKWCSVGLSEDAHVESEAKKWIQDIQDMGICEKMFVMAPVSWFLEGISNLSANPIPMEVSGSLVPDVSATGSSSFILRASFS